MVIPHSPANRGTRNPLFPSAITLRCVPVPGAYPYRWAGALRYTPFVPLLQTSSAAAPATPRLVLIDVARGLAILQMIAFHFCYDLDYFGWIHVSLLGDPRWIAWRSAIVTQFLFLVGISMVLRRGAADASAGRRFWRRWVQIAACAVVVSIATRPLFGPRFIWFGILHFVAATELLLVLAARLGPTLRPSWRIETLAAIGIGAIAIGLLVHLPAFDTNAWSWIGFAADKPVTEDFVPILPWIGVVLLGMAAGTAWRYRSYALPASWRWIPHSESVLRRSLPAFLGRWPLTIYMIHQPVLFGSLDLLRITLK